MKNTLAAHSWLAPLRQPLAPVAGCQAFGHLLLLLMSAWLALLASQATPRWPPRWIDLAGEGGLLLMLALWLWQLRASRPAGRVTSLLCLGLAGLLLGQWVDLLDELLPLAKAVWWDNAVESGCALLGMLLLTAGLHGWRQEQRVLGEALRRRERLFRDHQRLDSLTQLGDAAYLAAQVEHERALGRAGGLALLALPALQQRGRRDGLAAAERGIERAAQLLLLLLRDDELLGRYAGGCFVLLLPGCKDEQLQARVSTLRDALGLLGEGEARAACAPLLGDRPAAALMLSLLERLR